MRYCSNCGTKLETNMKYCPNCGKKCVAPPPVSPSVPTPPPRPRTSYPSQRQSSSGFWNFLAGTAVGTLFCSLFGRSSTASASPSAHATEHYHETIIYDHEDDESYGCDRMEEPTHSQGIDHGSSGMLYNDWKQDDFDRDPYETEDYDTDGHWEHDDYDDSFGDDPYDSYDSDDSYDSCDD